MSATTLLKILESYNVSENMSDEERRNIALQVIRGYDIDCKSRSDWLEINDRAMDIVHQTGDWAKDKDKPFEKSCKVIYPLLAPAIIQSAARLIPHLSRNGKSVEVAKFGEDPQGLIGLRSDRVSSFMNWQICIDSDWLMQSHKLIHILTSWGVCFRRVFYDRIEERTKSEIIHPQDVVVNNNIQTLQDCSRITVMTFLNKNDLISRVSAGIFNSDIDVEKLPFSGQEKIENDGRDTQPIYEILEQSILLDLDEDGYAEPYCAYVHKTSQTLLCLYPSFRFDDIKFSKDGKKVVAIKRRLDIIDYHYIDDPDGGFYSIGLNHLLVNHNDAITSLNRMLIDSGTLANYQNGIIGRIIKTKDRNLTFNKLGEFKVADIPPNIDLNNQIKLLPFKEPSVVLFQLLGLLVQSGKEVGFITDVLTGDMPAQNVPATTMLALVEQGTRAFKPIVQKLFFAQKKEFEIWFRLNRQYLTDEEYQRFHNNPQVFVVEDFDTNSLDIVPVADPTMSSEAHKYAKTNAIMHTIEMGVCPNVLEGLRQFYTTIEAENVDLLLTPPQSAESQVDPKVVKAEMDYDIKSRKLELDAIQLQQEEKKLELEELKAHVKEAEAALKHVESASKIQQMQANAFKDREEAKRKDDQVDIAKEGLELERQRLQILDRQSRNKNNSSTG